MFSVKNQVLSIIFLSIISLTGCGLPQQSNSGFPVASISSPPVILPNPSTTIVDSKNPQIAVDPTGIYVVWENKTGNNILFSYSNNGGNSFQIPISIPGSTGGTYPRMTTDGNGNLFVIWLNNNPPGIYLNYAISNTFQTTLQVSSTAVPLAQYQVPQGDITYAANTLYVAWSQCSSSNCSSPSLIDDIFLATVPVTNPISPSSITSSNFSTPQNITNSSSSAYYPKIVRSGSASNILYQITNPSGLYLYNTTTTTQYTVGNPSTASNAALSMDNQGNSYVAWNPNNSPHDLFFNFLKNGTTLFNSNIPNLSNNGNSIGPVLGIDLSQYVYVSFFSKTAANPSAFDVFLERSTDGGRSFSGAQNISNSPGDSLSYAPGMAIMGKTAYLVWDDNSSTNPIAGFHQICFQKLTLN